MTHQERLQEIQQGNLALGIELGSTRIKSVLLTKNHTVVATGSHTWSNRLEDGVWTYHLEDAWAGVQASYAQLANQVKEAYGVPLKKIGSLGISGMMHGYLPFDKEGTLLSPFRTWRNTMTEEAARQLTQAFSFNIPLRWSVAHLYHSMLAQDAHVGQIDYLTTLAGYIHWKLSGQRVLGVGEASGMFPIDATTNTYDATMVATFDQMAIPHNVPWKLQDILPQTLTAGVAGGTLTEEGAALLDPTGTLQPWVPMAPPEGDAGTGMVCTNAVAVGTGNVSAGTSIFSMVVLEKSLSKMYPEVDMVTTPSGKPVAMIHCNNGTSDIDAWMGIFQEYNSLFGVELTPEELYTKLYQASLSGAASCDGITVYNYLSGEPITGLAQGRPMVVRRPEGQFTLANFMRAQLYGTLASLRIGMEILEREQVTITRLTGHGGFFKTPVVGQRYMAAAVNAPVTVMETAGEGGPYGMALLAGYMLWRQEGETLEDYLENHVFSQQKGSTLQPDATDVAGFVTFLETYRRGIGVQELAVTTL